MKILMTGMASAHCSVKGNVTFFQGLYRAFSSFCDVTICEPKPTWTRSDLEAFDLVVVGLTPPTSLAANKIYGAFHVLDLMYESPKLRLVVDSPQLWQFKNSIASFKRSPLQILGAAYKSRKNYSLALDSLSGEFVSLAEKMSTLIWPKTYLPKLPWASTESAAIKTGFVPPSRALGIQIDSFFLDRAPSASSSMVKKQQWAVENFKSTWWSLASKLLRLPGVPTADGSRPKDSQVESVISASVGLVVPPQDRKVGTWWTYRYIQALNSNTPVITHWQDTAQFSEAWSKLAYQVEDMDAYDRQDLARIQYKDYTDNVPNSDQVVETLRKDLIESTQERI